jgi:glycosyltransferase involved in cell wall biosynthesis
MSYSDINSGNATRLLNLAKNLSKEFKVDIFFDGNKNNHIPHQFKNLKINFTPYLKNLWITLSCGVFHKMIKGLKNYDIIHCFKPLPSSFFPSLFISKVKGIKLIVDWDDWEGKRGFAEFDPFFLRDFLDWFQIFSIKNAYAITTPSTFLQKTAEKFNRKVYLIPNGVDIDLFNPNIKKLKIRNKFNCPLIVFVGLLNKACDIDVVIRAMTYVTKKIDAKLLIVGGGPRKKEFMRLVKECKMEKNIIFEDYKPREFIPEFIKIADVAVLPMKDNLANRSRSPVKLGEYLACGKAVVASNVGIAKKIIKNYYNGILTSNEPENFGKSIIKLLENNNLRKKLEKNARKTAERKLDWKKIAKKLEEIYLKIGAEKNLNF